MSTATLLTDEEQRALPARALRGDCKAAERLGDFYMTQLADPTRAEKWYRLADSCKPDSRIKEFLINTIILNGKDESRINFVERIYHEVEKIDPLRAKRLHDSVEEYVGHPLGRESG